MITLAYTNVVFYGWWVLPKKCHSVYNLLFFCSKNYEGFTFKMYVYFFRAKKRINHVYIGRNLTNFSLECQNYHQFFFCIKNKQRQRKKKNSDNTIDLVLVYMLHKPLFQAKRKNKDTTYIATLKSKLEICKKFMLIFFIYCRNIYVITYIVHA